MSNLQQTSLRAVTLTLAAALGVGVVVDAWAQSSGSARDRADQRRAEREQRKGGSQAKQAVEYPQATRKEPDVKASSKMSSKLQKLVKAYDDDKVADVRAGADEIIADPKANAYDRAFAAQLAANSTYSADDLPAAMGYLNRTLEFDGLDNNGHYNSMLMLAQLQMQQGQYKEALAMFDRFFNETRSQKPEHLALKGNALYRLDRFPEAATVLKQAIAASPEPKADWQQLLLGAYFEMNQPGEAAKLAEQIAAKSPNDKRVQMNLAATYMQGDQMDKAAAILDKLHRSGQLTEEKEYRQLYSIYLNMDGKEKQAIAVINEGLQKGILKPDYKLYTALAQAYYFSEQPGPAIDAYRKAAPLAPDGESYLNLAKVLWQEDRIGEAKQAAQQALNKGVKRPADAKKIIALPGK